MTEHEEVHALTDALLEFLATRKPKPEHAIEALLSVAATTIALSYVDRGQLWEATYAHARAFERTAVKAYDEASKGRNN